MKMKTVLFDLLLSQPDGKTVFHGGGEYIKSVFRELAEKHLDRIKLIVFYNHSGFMDDWVEKMIEQKKIESLDIRKPSDITSVLAEREIDVFYTGMSYHYDKSMFPKEIYTIGTFHGLRDVECPHDEYEYKYMSGKQRLKEQIRFYLKSNPRFGYGKRKRDALTLYEKCIKSFDKIITDSDHSAYSLANYFPQLDSQNINIFYPPLKTSESVSLKHFKGRFFLMISGNRWIKNAYRALKALDDLYDRGHIREIKTVVAGSVPKSIIAEMKHKEMFRFISYIDDDLLAALYRDCEAFIYPTLNEGFGYPPLEAMRFGTTCIVSAVCSLPEICGKAVFYVNPLDIGEIQNRILHAANQKIDRETVKMQFDKIRSRQESDLKKLCDMICMGRDGNNFRK